jgi:hypothetical protein
MKRFLYFLPYLLFALALLACNTNKAPIDLGIDSGLLSEKPCKAPCWQNLIPSVSTSGNVADFINTLNKHQWQGEFVKSYETGCKYIRISDVPGNQVTSTLEFNLENEKLTLIQSSHPKMPNLKQITDHSGPPEYFEAIRAVGPDGELYIVEVYYPKLGLAFLIATSNANLGAVKEEMLVDTIQYFSPGDLLSYFTTRNSCDLGEKAAKENAEYEISKYVQPWHGFGEVNVIQSR